MMRILGDGNLNHRITLLQLLCLLPVGTRVCVRYDSCDDVYFHTVESSAKALGFLTRMNRRFKHMLEVYEVSVAKNDSQHDLDLWCI